MISPKGKAPGSHMLVEYYVGHPDTPTMIVWTISGRKHRISSPRKVTYPCTIPALDGLTKDFPWNPS